LALVALLALGLTWVAFVGLLAITRPRGMNLREVARFVPEIVRLVRRLAQDGELPRGVRVRLACLLAYLALPFDIVPDFIPVLGYADDVIVVALVLRSVIRRAGQKALSRHWTGTAEGLRLLHRLVGVKPVGERG
jgi:uncharacterized membrane protein YkvA (DUF1232 family)